MENAAVVVDGVGVVEGGVGRYGVVQGGVTAVAARCWGTMTSSAASAVGGVRRRHGCGVAAKGARKKCETKANEQSNK